MFGLESIFLLGIFFRVFLANKLSFTYDELWAFNFANENHSLWEHIVSPLDDRPPLHYMLMQLQSSVSQSVLWLRFPSIITSALVILLAAAMARKVSRRFTIAIILFGVVSYSSIRYATLARDYGFIVFAAWLQIRSIWNWIQPNEQAVRTKVDWHQAVQWAVAAFLGIGLNYVYLPFLVSLLVGLLATMWRQYRLKMITLQMMIQRLAVLAVATLPTIGMLVYYLLIYNQFATIQDTTEWIHQPTLREVLDLLTIHFGLGTYTNWASLAFGFVIIGFGLLKAWGTTHDRSFIIFSLVTMSCNIVGLVTISLLGSSYFLLRYFAPLSVVSMMLLSYLGWRLWELASRPIQIFLLAWFFLAYVPYLLSETNNRLGFYGSLEKYGTEQARLMQTIKEEWRPGDQLIFSPKSYGDLYRGFYFHEPIYKSSTEIAEQINPIDLYACEKRKKFVFPEGTKLIVAAVSETAYEQPESILISETTKSIYPDYEVAINELCADKPVEILKMSQSAAWTCTLKTELRLTQFCYLP